MPIDSIKIFPAIGIARVGNSTEFFIGPEIPSDHTPPPGGYKDNKCRVKRQAARFRLFGYDGNTLVQEITSDDGEITWTAELANKKAAWFRFTGATQSSVLRNSGVSNRSSLEITPGVKSITGPNQAAGFNTGQFLGRTVRLGEMRTDTEGRLIIIGGFGNSGSVPSGESIMSYANNDKWHDDTSDGPITAQIVLSSTSTTIIAEPAWVICPPPNFVPVVDSITSLYDTLLQTAIDKGLPGVSVPTTPSFTNDIWPILQRVFDMIRVTTPAASGHFDFDGTTASSMNQARRQAIFNRLRNPNNPNAGGAANMPFLYDDSNNQRHTITKTQYTILQKWAGTAGTDWINDWPGSPPIPAPSVDLTAPHELTRAALEACVGAAFFPGIEASWFLRDDADYSEPFRLNHSAHNAGDITKQMAVPWQADFWKCSRIGNYAWWPAVRPDDVFLEDGSGRDLWTRGVVTSPDGHEKMVFNWHKLGFVVRKDGELVETERRLVCRSLTLVTDRSHFSADEVASFIAAGAPALFENSFYVIAEGFTPAELNITTPSPTPAELLSIAPSITFIRENGTTAPGMSADAIALLPQDTSLPPMLRQRFTYVYPIAFADPNIFFNGGVAVESQRITLQAVKNIGALGNFSTEGSVILFHQPNPYMLDGATHWLSTDVRVFKVTEGQPLYEQTMGGTGNSASSFIANVVDYFNRPDHVSHPFDDITNAPLELSQSVGGQRVFNFAIARVRYRGNVLDAENVRVFFRMFRTAATGMDYNENSTYRRTPGTSPISLLGIQAGETVTIPFFGDPRIDTATEGMSDQTDIVNERTLEHAGADERHGYFGCWLDFNQEDPSIPREPVPANGPWPSGRASIQQLIRGEHQCLVAEVYFPTDPIPGGISPASNDNLAQRNLAIVQSDNPGGPATHRVQHTFEIKSSHRLVKLTALVAPVEEDSIEFSQAQAIPPGPDELMIRWNNLPRASEMTLYMPSTDVDEILEYAGQNYEAVRLEKIDAHTLRCLPGDVNYIPLPFGRARNIAALLTISLPEDVKRKQEFDVVVHQLSGRPRHVLGAFQFKIPVSDKALLLEPEIRKLSVLRHIALAIPTDDQWYPIFERYLGQIADRVRGFGGDPDIVEPSPDGTGINKTDARCRRLRRFYILLLALFIILAAILPVGRYLAGSVVLVGLLIATVLWLVLCTISRCRWVIATILGLGIGIAATALLTLIGLANQGQAILILVALLLGITLGVGIWWGCFKYKRV